MISYPQQRASPILEKAREGSHRGPADEGWANGGGGPQSWSPCGPLLQLAAYRSEKQEQDESTLWEAGGGWE